MSRLPTRGFVRETAASDRHPNDGRIAIERTAECMGANVIVCGNVVALESGLTGKEHGVPFR
jgi:curli biogenesis system outer membrane secretion channel CsgG